MDAGPSHAATLARGRAPVLAAATFLVTLWVFAPVRANDWVRYDDPDYVLANPPVRAGWSAEGIRWAFTHEHAANYHPLTWLSHMLDVELFGLEPGPAHLVSALLHALNAALAFALLRALLVPRELAGAGPAPAPLARDGAAALGALAFALHPLRVESVAWASERKDVLCGAFFLATLLLWLALRRRDPSARSPALVVALFVVFALALLAKPMAVSLPLIVLLLERAPRAGSEPAPRPRPWILAGLLALAAAASAATLWAQGRGGSTSSLDSLSLGVRSLNALRSLGVYLGQSLLPRGLSVYYPHPALGTSAPLAALLWPALGGALSFGIPMALAWRVRKRIPALAAGLALFLVMLLPVIGLVQVGAQAHADRYTYLPSLGLALALAGGVLALGPRAARAVVPLALLGLLALTRATRAQIGVWRDTRTLFEHALELDERNDLAHEKLGELALEEGDEPRARAAFERAVACNPGNVPAWNKLALCALEREDLPAAREHARRALALSPDDVEALTNLGVIELDLGAPEEARRCLERALARAPDDAQVLFNSGVLALRTGARGEAESRFQQALARDPEHADAWSNLGQVRLADGRTGEALTAFERVVALAPDDPVAHFNLGVARRAAGDSEGARAAFRRALALAPDLDAAREALEAAD